MCCFLIEFFFFVSFLNREATVCSGILQQPATLALELRRLFLGTRRLFLGLVASTSGSYQIPRMIRDCCARQLLDFHVQVQDGKFQAYRNSTTDYCVALDTISKHRCRRFC